MALWQRLWLWQIWYHKCRRIVHFASQRTQQTQVVFPSRLPVESQAETGTLFQMEASAWPRIKLRPELWPARVPVSVQPEQHPAASSYLEDRTRQQKPTSGSAKSPLFLPNRHGSLNVPIEHHPTIRYMVYNGYYKVMSNIPKMGQLPTPDRQQLSVYKRYQTIIGSARAQRSAELVVAQRPNTSERHMWHKNCDILWHIIEIYHIYYIYSYVSQSFRPLDSWSSAPESKFDERATSA